MALLEVVSIWLPFLLHQAATTLLCRFFSLRCIMLGGKSKGFLTLSTGYNSRPNWFCVQIIESRWSPFSAMHHYVTSNFPLKILVGKQDKSFSCFLCFICTKEYWHVTVLINLLVHCQQTTSHCCTFCTLQLMNARCQVILALHPSTLDNCQCTTWFSTT